MKKKVLLFLIVSLTSLIFTTIAFAELTTKFYGYQWLRYTDVVYGKDKQGVSYMFNPRTYLRWKMEDKDVGWVGEITLDINNVKGGQEISTSSANTGATDADGAGTTITVTHTHTYDKASGKVDFAIWLKYAYVDFTKIPFLSDIEAKLRIGIQKNYFGTVELWEYPLIEKEISDLRKIISSADLGIALLGELPEGYGSYEIAMHNGKGYKNIEDNVEKQYTASLMLLPISGLMMRGSYMINNVAAYGTPSKIKRATAFVGQYNFNGFFIPLPLVLLAEYVVVSDQAVKSATKSGVAEGLMFVGLLDVTEWLQLAARFDDWNPDTNVKNDEVILFASGINLKITANHLLQLNYQIDRPKYGGYIPEQHINTWMAQLKWSW